jgi:3-phenylpropionate/trans-cinnamate dioxygenase ferredoxin reductase subunit
MCGSCVARIVNGSTILGETAAPGMVYSCQARILSDLEIEFEKVPPVSVVEGNLAGLRRLAPDVFELSIKPARRLPYLPGQYFKFQFEGFPARSYSATRPIDRRPQGTRITLQVRRFDDGRVSGALGRAIRPGHPVVIEGPFGSAFFRPGKTGRLVLVSSGTGFAPIWSIAGAALRENPNREIFLIAGVRSVDPIYMAAALERVSRFPNVTALAAIGRRPSPSPEIKEGYPNENLPELNENDIVYACGGRQMIEALTPIVAQAQAQFFCDPFEPAPVEDDHLLLESAKRLRRLLSATGRIRLPLPGVLIQSGSGA